jgi:hypothetical protein
MFKVKTSGQFIIKKQAGFLYAKKGLSRPPKDNGNGAKRIPGLGAEELHQRTPIFISSEKDSPQRRRVYQGGRSTDF